MIGVGLGLLVFFFFSGASLAIALGLGSSLALVFGLHEPLPIISQGMFERVNSFTLLAAPLFITAGMLMVGGGAKYIVTFFDDLVGHLPGGMLVATVGAATLFAAITGSTLASIAIIGSIMIPEMTKKGYPPWLAAGVVAASGCLGNIIPPSQFFILYSVLTEQSAARLFAAGMIPGLIISILFIVVGVIICKVINIPLKEPVSWRQRGASFVKAIPAFLMPVIILGGIYTGFFTPTEAGAVSVVIAILVGFLVYREFTFKSFISCIKDAAILSSVIYFLIIGVQPFTHLVSRLGAPAYITSLVVGAQLSPIGFLLILNALYLFFGFFIEAWAILFMIVPVLVPVFQVMNVDLIQVGVLFALACQVGYITPPMAVGLYFTSKVSGVPPGQVIKGATPFLLSMVAVLILIVFIPELATWLPEVIVGR